MAKAIRRSILGILVFWVSALLFGCGAVSNDLTTTLPKPTSAAVKSVEIELPASSVAAGSISGLAVTAIFTDGTRSDISSKVTLASSDTSIITFSVDGSGRPEIVTRKPGQVTITATYEGLQASSTFTVSAAALVSLQVTPISSTLAKGTDQILTAVGIYSDMTKLDLTSLVSWAVSNASVATINGSGSGKSAGTLTAVQVGTVEVSATLGIIIAKVNATVTPATLVSIAVTPINLNVFQGFTKQLTATGIFTDKTVQDLTTQVTWASTNSDVASISNAAGSNGSVTGLLVGSSAISATSGAVSGSSNLTVTATTLVSIALTPVTPRLNTGLTKQLTATATFSDNSTQDITSDANWASAAPSVAAISNVSGSKGLATGLTIGTSVITASFKGLTSASQTLTVALPVTEAYTSPGSFDWIVPAGVTSINVVATGGGGGGSGSGALGGNGAKVTSSLAVVPGSSLRLVVGGGGFEGSSISGGGGGGSSNVQVGSANPIIVAGGGGGGGSGGPPSSGFLGFNGGNGGANGDSSVGSNGGGNAGLNGLGGIAGAGTFGAGRSGASGSGGAGGAGGSGGIIGGGGQSGVSSGSGIGGGGGAGAPSVSIGSGGGGGGGGGGGYGGGGGGVGVGIGVSGTRGGGGGGGGGNLGPAGSTFSTGSNGGAVTSGNNGSIVISY